MQGVWYYIWMYLQWLDKENKNFLYAKIGRWDMGHCSFLAVIVQLLSHVWFSVTPRTAAYQASPSLNTSQSLLRFMSVELVMLSNHLILCCPILLLLSIFHIRVFSKESAFCIRWQSTGASASASVLPMSIQGWFPLGLAGLISLQSPCRLLRVFSSTTIWKHQFFGTQP